MYATLVFLVGFLKWALGVVGSVGFLGHGLAAIAVLVFSRGVYNRSLVSGVLLLGTALGPTVSGLSLEGRVMEVSALGGLEVTNLLAGLGLGALVLRALYRLSTDRTFRSREGATR